MYRSSFIFFVLVLTLLTTAFFCYLDARSRIKNMQDNKIIINRVEKYYLTDLVIFSDASYMRHLTQSDFFVPFQDNPISFDIYPTASLVKPPHLIF